MRLTIIFNLLINRLNFFSGAIHNNVLYLVINFEKSYE